jgi:hypothetical protein
MGRKRTPSGDDAQATNDDTTAGHAVAPDHVELPGKFDAVLIPALAAGNTQKVAAERAGCSVTYVERRVADPQFRLRLIEAHAELRDALMASSISAAQIATTFLLGVVTGSERGVTMNQRIRAAIALRQGVVAWTDREGIGR